MIAYIMWSEGLKVEEKRAGISCDFTLVKTEIFIFQYQKAWIILEKSS